MMQAGRELDALVAEKVMGYKWFKSAHPHTTVLEEPRRVTSPDYFPCPLAERDDKSPGWNRARCYSTDIAAAWQVIDHLRKSHPFMSLYFDDRSEIDSPYWFCDWSDQHHSGIGAVADTAPLAICLAALKAVGVDMDAPSQDVEPLREQLEGFNVAVT